MMSLGQTRVPRQEAAIMQQRVYYCFSNNGDGPVSAALRLIRGQILVLHIRKAKVTTANLIPPFFGEGVVCLLTFAAKRVRSLERGT